MSNMQQNQNPKIMEVIKLLENGVRLSEAIDEVDTQYVVFKAWLDQQSPKKQKEITQIIQKNVLG